MLPFLVSLFDRRIQFMYLQVDMCFSAATLFKTTNTIDEQELLSQFYFFFTHITLVKQTSRIQCKYLMIFFYIYV